MGLLVDGQWQDRWYENSNDGEFQREQAQRRDWVTTDGSPGLITAPPFRHKQVAIISMYRWPAPGLIAP